MSQTPIVIFGVTPFAEMVAHYFETYTDCAVVAYTAHARFVRQTELAGKPVVAFEELTRHFAPGETHYFAAIEYKWLNAAREEISMELAAMGYKPATFIHPASRVAPNAIVGSHNFLMEDVTLSYQSKLGSNNILFPGTIVGAAARIGDHNYIQQGLSLGRHGEIGRNCVICADTTIGEGVKVGDWCYLRTRMNVEANIPAGTTYNPLLRSPGFVVDRRAAQAA